MNTKLALVFAIVAMASFGFVSESANATLPASATIAVHVNGQGITVNNIASGSEGAIFEGIVLTENQMSSATMVGNIETAVNDYMSFTNILTENTQYTLVTIVESIYYFEQFTPLSLVTLQAERDAVTTTETATSITFDNIGTHTIVTFKGASGNLSLDVTSGDTMNGLTEATDYTYEVIAYHLGQIASTVTITVTTPQSQATIDANTLQVAEDKRDAVIISAVDFETISVSGITSGVTVTQNSNAVSNGNFTATASTSYDFIVSATNGNQTAQSITITVVTPADPAVAAQAALDAANLVLAETERDLVIIISESSTSVLVSGIGNNTTVLQGTDNVINGSHGGFTPLQQAVEFDVSTTIGGQTAVSTIFIGLQYNATELAAQAQAAQDVADLAAATLEMNAVVFTSDWNIVSFTSVGANTVITLDGNVVSGSITATEQTTYDFVITTTIGTQSDNKTVSITTGKSPATLDAEALAQVQADLAALNISYANVATTPFDSAISNIGNSVQAIYIIVDGLYEFEATIVNGATVFVGLNEETTYGVKLLGERGQTAQYDFTTPTSQATIDARIAAQIAADLSAAETERDAVTHNTYTQQNTHPRVSFSNIGTNTQVTFEGSIVTENTVYSVTGLQDYTYSVSTTISGQTATSTVNFTATMSGAQSQQQIEDDLAAIVISFSPDAATATLSNISDRIYGLFTHPTGNTITVVNGVASLTGLNEETTYQIAGTVLFNQKQAEISFTTPQSQMSAQADFDAAELAAQAELAKVTLTATQGVGFTVSNSGTATVTFNGEVVLDGAVFATGAGSFTVQVEVTVTVGTQTSTMSTEITVIVDEEKKKRKFIPSYPTNIVGININGMDINVDRHDIMLETPVKSFGLTTIQVSLDDPEGDMIGLRVYIEQPDFHDTGYSKANVYGAEIYVTGKHSEMTGYTIDNIETNDKNDFYWVSQDKDFNNLGQILSAEVLSVKLIERDVKTSNLIEGNFDVNKVVEIQMINTFDMEGATIYVLANDRDSNMQMFKIYNALTVEHIGSQGFEDMNEGGCGKTGNHNNWTACVKNPYTYVR